MVFDPHGTLETLAIRFGAPHLGDGALARMRKANERLRRAIDEGDAVTASRADEELHAVYVEATGNSELVDILSSLKTKLRRLEILYFGGSVIAARSADEHDDLIDALGRGDVETAVGLVRDNWQRSYERILAPVQAAPGSGQRQTEGEEA